MKVYGDPGSSCTRKVLAVLAEKGQDAELILVSIRAGEQKKPEHMARHPFGKVPVLDDDGFLLYESRAIMRYLDQKLSSPALTPADPRDRARMEQWISIEQSYFSGPVMDVVLQMLGKLAGKEPDMTIVERGRSGAARALDLMDRHLETSGHLAVMDFTLADISWAPYVQRLMDFGFGNLVTERAAVAEWWRQVGSRPAWQKTISL